MRKLLIIGPNSVYWMIVCSYRVCWKPIELPDNRFSYEL